MTNSVSRLIGMKLFVNDEPFGFVKDVLFNDTDMALSVLVIVRQSDTCSTELLLPIRDITNIALLRTGLMIQSDKNKLWVRLNRNTPVSRHIS